MKGADWQWGGESRYFSDLGVPTPFPAKHAKTPKYPDFGVFGGLRRGAKTPIWGVKTPDFGVFRGGILTLQRAAILIIRQIGSLVGFFGRKLALISNSAEIWGSGVGPPSGPLPGQAPWGTPKWP